MGQATNKQLSFLGSADNAPEAQVTAKKELKEKGSSGGKKGRGGRRATAESMATKQREISVSEFFTKNRHLLGFDNPSKALLTAVKEAVDNSLDACEEAGILPRVSVALQQTRDDRYRVVVEDNGPGIIKEQVPKIFGKLLYGSKFHRLKQSRGQQGIGISAAGMYGQLTTGKPVVITTRISEGRPAYQYELILNTRKNTPEILAEREVEWQAEHGTRVEIELEGSYKAGRRSVDEYLEQVAIANPHAEVRYAPPKGKAPIHLPRAAEELPPEPKEIKPHPYGVELGMLIKLLKESKVRTVSGALQEQFSRVTPRVAEAICDVAKVRPKASPRTLLPPDIERIFRGIPKVKIVSPPTNCVVPIGEVLIQRGLEREIKADLYVSSTRPPSVYRGNPFRVEVGLAYGGALRSKTVEDDAAVINRKRVDKGEGPITLIRFANRVPLQYQQSACAIFKAVSEGNWKQYGLSHPRGALPLGPMVLLVHIASVWVPFTSESKEAIAHYPEIIKEIKLGLRDCGRKLNAFLRRREKDRIQAKRRSIFEMYIGELARSLSKLTDLNARRIQNRLMTLAAKHAGVAEEAGIEPGDGELAEPAESAQVEADESPAERLAREARATKAAAKKAPAKKAPAKKKVAAKKAPAKKAAAKEVPAKKAAAKKKAPAVEKKAPAKKTTRARKASSRKRK